MLQRKIYYILNVIHVVYHDQPDVSSPYFVQASSEKHCELQPNADISEPLATRATQSRVNRSEVNILLKPFQFFFSPFQFPSYAILIACLLAVSILFILMLSLLFWKRKYP